MNRGSQGVVAGEQRLVATTLTPSTDAASAMAHAGGPAASTEAPTPSGNMGPNGTAWAGSAVVPRYVGKHVQHGLGADLNSSLRTGGGLTVALNSHQDAVDMIPDPCDEPPSYKPQRRGNGAGKQCLSPWHTHHTFPPPSDRHERPRHPAAPVQVTETVSHGIPHLGCPAKGCRHLHPTTDRTSGTQSSPLRGQAE